MNTGCNKGVSSVRRCFPRDSDPRKMPKREKHSDILNCSLACRGIECHQNTSDFLQTLDIQHGMTYITSNEARKTPQPLRFQVFTVFLKRRIQCLRCIGVGWTQQSCTSNFQIFIALKSSILPKHSNDVFAQTRQEHECFAPPAYTSH